VDIGNGRLKPVTEQNNGKVTKKCALPIRMAGPSPSRHHNAVTDKLQWQLAFEKPVNWCQPVMDLKYNRY